MKLTDKDIVLLKFSSCVLILFFMIRFAIMPGIETCQDSIFESQDLEEQVQEMEDAIASIPDLEESVKDRTEDLKTVSSDYYTRMENRQVDELLTGLALQYNLFPVSMSIEDVQPGVPSPYLYDPSLENDGSGDGESADTDADSSQGAEEESSDETETETTEAMAVPAQKDYVLTGICNMVLRGEEQNMLQFMDAIEKNDPALQIRTMQWEKRTYLDTEWNVKEEPEVHFTLAVYMCDL